MTTMLQAALKIAKNGRPVFPVSRDTKKPLTEKGFHDATTNPEQIQDWWNRYPVANIAVPTGGMFFVLDVDKHGDTDGQQTLNELIAQYDPLPDTRTVQTGGGGIHYYFLMPDFDLRNSSNKLGPGLDIRGNGGYVVVPPSIHETGNSYKLLKNNSIAPAPEWLIILLKEISTDEHFIPSKFTKTDGLPGNEYNERGDVESLLAKHGWQKVKDFAAKEYWCRPGKRKGTSATFQKDMRIFYCFTGNAPPLEADKAYSPFSLYAVLEHGGDYTAAAKRLREEGYGEKITSHTKYSPKEPPGDFVTAVDLTRKYSSLVLPDDVLYYHFIGQGVDTFTCEGTPGVPSFALATTIGIIAHAIGNQAELNASRSNLLIVKCGPSSAGKSFNENMLIKKLNHKFKIITEASSGIALARWLGGTHNDDRDMYDLNNNEAVGYFIKDEGESIFTNDETNGKDLREALLKLFNAPRFTKAYADSEKFLNVPLPHLTLMANTTPVIFDNIDHALLERGTLPRFLFFVSRENNLNRVRPGRKFNEKLNAFVKTLNEIRKAKVPDSYFQMQILEYSKEAEIFYDKITLEHKRKSYLSSESSQLLTAKYSEFLNKLSLVAHAAKYKGDFLLHKTVDLDSLEWADKTIKCIMAQSGIVFEQSLSTGKFDADRLLFIRAIEKCIEKNKKPTLSQLKRLQRKIRNWSPRHTTSVIDSLLMDETIFISKSRKRTDVFNLIKQDED